MKYLKGTFNHGIFVNAQDGISLVAYSDADYMQGTEKQDDQQAVLFLC